LLRKNNHFANALSGGERQMLAIGQALMSRPSLLLLDEPSAGLSPRAVGQVFETLVEMRTTGVSALIVEQAVQQALEVSDRGYVLEAGRIVMHDRAQELRGNQEITDAYIGRLGKS
jgi:branched-chain amino acid transport system ATP-binding protein